MAGPPVEPVRSNHRSNSIWIILFLAAALAIGGGRLWRIAQPGAILPIAQRRAMPPLVFSQLDGNPWTLAGHRGQVVLINYWATWCEPCREELPALIQLAHDTAPPNSVAIVGVALDSGPSAPGAIRSFAARFHLPYPIAIPDAITRTGLDQTTLPTTVLLDKHGRVARTYRGATELTAFQKDIASLLAEN